MLAPLLRSRVRGRHTAARASGGFSRPDGGTDHFDGVIVGAGTIAERARSAEVHEAARAVVERLEPDDYAVYVCDFMEEGRRRAGDAWSYADITTVLYAATELLQPESYLEIGVR